MTASGPLEQLKSRNALFPMAWCTYPDQGMAAGFTTCGTMPLPSHLLSILPPSRTYRSGPFASVMCPKFLDTQEWQAFPRFLEERRLGFGFLFAEGRVVRSVGPALMIAARRMRRRS